MTKTMETMMRLQEPTGADWGTLSANEQTAWAAALKITKKSWDTLNDETKTAWADSSAENWMALNDEEKSAWLAYAQGKRLRPAETLIQKENRKRIEPELKAYRRFPYEIAVFVLALLTSIPLAPRPLSLIIGVLAAFASILWVVATYYVARAPLYPRNFVIYDKVLFPGQFIIVGMLFVSSLMNYGIVPATILVLTLTAIPYIGTWVVIKILRFL